MSVPELQERFAFFSRRAKSLCGVIMAKGADGKLSPRPLGQAVSEFFVEMGKSLTDPAKIAARNEFLARAQTDPQANAQFCALRLEMFNNYLLTQLDWINYYAEVVSLAPEQAPYEQNETGFELQCTFLSQDGSPKMIRMKREEDQRALPLRLISTPRVRYKVFDLYRGNVVDAALRTLKLSFDLANDMNAEFFTLIKTAAFGAFTFPGSQKVNYPYVKSKHIVAANLPATNDITVPAASGTTKFDFATLDAIIKYAAQWNKLSMDGDIRPTGRIRVPSVHISDFGSAITPAGATSNPIADALLEQGWNGVSYRRINWIFEPAPDLDPALNTCYPEFSQKPARVFFKAAADKEIVRGDEVPELFEANEQERQTRKAYGASINTASRRKIARFKYTV
ncbi:MAG: hypothetical protein A2Y38_01880 [Spirochaetes bacterium GWB1_59_5]|nr:MAG: hypothetical protein A2Y38_01880 [Spirochaetes bacterium GWB1_59_5]